MVAFSLRQNSREKWLGESSVLVLELKKDIVIYLNL